MANADISLLFGVLGDGSLSGESGALIQSQLNQIVAALNKNPLKVKVGLDTTAGGQKSWSSQLQSRLNAISSSGKFSIQVSNIKIGAGAIADFKRQLNTVINTLNLDKGTSVTVDAKGIGEIKSNFDKVGESASSAAKKTAEFKVQMEGLNNLRNSVKNSLNSLTQSGSSIENAEINQLVERYRAWAIEIERVNASKSIKSGYREQLVAEGSAIQANINSLIEEDSRLKNRATQLKQVETLLGQVAKAQRDWTAAQNGSQSANYSKLQGVISGLENLRTQLNNGTISAEQFRQEYAKLRTSFVSVSNNIKAAGENTKTFSERMTGLAAKFSSWLTVSQIIMLGYRSLRQMVTAVYDVDKAMTELKKVTDETDAAYSRFLTNAISRAKELGATVSDTVNATADFARLGYNIDDASKLADAAIIYKNVGDGIEDISEASQSIISTMQAFSVAAEDAMLVVDKFNEVGNNFAISSQGVGEALLRSASSLAAGNNTLDESIALITTANTIVQNPEAVGTTMKTISMYLRAAKTEAEEAGESTDGMANSVSELRSEILALTNNKVDIQIDENNFKSTYQIIKELAGVWDELTDITQANILEMIGGKRNSNVVSALIDNFSLAEEVVAESATAAGSALAENEKYLDSIAGKVAEFKATFQEFSVTLIDSEFVKGVVEFGTGLLNVLNALAKVIDAIGGLNTVLKVTLGIIVAMNTKSIASFLTGLLKPIKSLIEIMTAAKAAGIGFGQAMSNAFAQASAGATAFQTALGVVGIAIAAISAAVAIATTVYNEFHKSNEELIQDANDLKSAYQSTAEEMSSNLSTLKSLEDEFYSLSDGVDEYGNNISLAADDYERYQEIVSTIVGISPSLVAGYDDEGRAIANKNGLLEKSIELMEEEQRLKMKEFVSDDNITTIGMGEVAAIDEFQSGKINPGYGTYIADGLRFDLGKAIQDASDSNTDIDEYDIFSAFGLEDKWSDYLYASSNRMQNLVSDYYDDISETILTNREALRDVFSESELDAFSEMITEHQKNIDMYEQELDKKQSALNPTLQYIPQTVTAYRELTDGQKEFLTQYINNLRITADTTEEDILQMKQDILDLTEFVAGNEDLKQTIDLGVSIKYGVDEDGEQLSVSDYKERLKELENQINNYDDEVQIKIKAALGIETDVSEINKDADKAIEHVKKLLKDEFDDEVNNLSISEVLQIYYNISADPNSMTFEELEAELEMLGVDWSKTIDVWDFSTMVDGLGEVESGIGSLLTAMNSLRDGTKLTKGELAKLALQYPELLKVSDLFADTSIENQHAMLDAVLSTYESEYDALIDTKIAELNATNQLMQDQIDLENEKKNKVIEIADLQSNGKIDSEAEYQRILNELRDLEGKNYVTYSDGILSVNQDMLQKELEQTGEKVEETRPLFEAQGNLIAEANFKGTSEGLKAFPQYASKLSNWAGTSFKKILSNIGTNIGKAFSGDTDFVGVFSGVNDIGSVLTNTITLETQIEGSYTIDDKSIDEWSSEYQDVIEQRIETITEQITANETIIKNLESLKGLDLKSIYTNNSSNKDGSSDSIEEYIADIEDYREAIERLNRVQLEKASLENKLSNTDDLKEKVKIEKQMLGVYEREQEALHIFNDLRDNTISNGAEALRQLGFLVEYDPDNNRFFVENLEHLNELVATEQGEYESMQEATNALRQNTEDLIDSLEELNVANQEGSESWWELKYAIEEAKENIVNNLKEIVTQASEAVDEIQNVYDTLKAAADEYAANGGFISVDAFQDIVSLGPEYMQYLRDENGLLVINEENINKVIAAKTQQLALDNAMSYVERLRLALQKDSIEDLNTLLYATTDTTNATWGLVYANLALLDLNDEQYAAALHNINAIRTLANSAVAGIGQVAGSASTELEDMKTGLDDILQYVMDMLEQKINNQIQALEDMKESYRDIIDLRKEALDAAKEEEDYQDSVSDKIREIAELQERINALALDDSRDAQSQRAKLEEEMYELQKELADKQSDYALDSQKDSLDDMAEAYESEKDKEIAILEESISSYQKLYDMAIDYIQNNWDTLYNELIAWNTEYGSVLNSEITTAWDNCLAAAQRYGSYVAALNKIDADISASGGGGSGNSSNIVVGDSGSYDGPSNEDMVRAIVGRMKEYGSQWSPSNSDATNKKLHEAAAAEAAKLDRYGVHASFEPASGTWRITRDDLNPSNVGKLLHSVYHQGGVAGDNPTLKQNEVLSILEKGEVILDEPKEKELFRLIDFTTSLSDKLSEIISSNWSNGTIAGSHIAIPQSDDITPISENSNSVHFGDVYIYGSSEEAIEKHREINRKFTNEVLRQLNIKK